MYKSSPWNMVSCSHRIFRPSTSRRHRPMAPWQHAVEPYCHWNCFTKPASLYSASCRFTSWFSLPSSLAAMMT